jgi:hypothetical protein
MAGVLSSAAVSTGAAGLNQLQRVKGTVGYQPPNRTLR